MQRVSGANYLANGAGDGKSTYQDYNPTTGQAGTTPNAAALTALQEEIAGFIEEQGLALNPADNTQLRQAIAAYVAAQNATFETSAAATAALAAAVAGLDNPSEVAAAIASALAGYMPLSHGMQSSGQQTIGVSTVLGASQAGANLIIGGPGITLTFPSTEVTYNLSNAGAYPVTLAYPTGTDYKLTMLPGETVILAGDGGGFWRTVAEGHSTGMTTWVLAQIASALSPYETAAAATSALASAVAGLDNPSEVASAIASALTSYATLANLSNYLTTAAAAANYATLANLGSYLTTAAAAANYAPLASQFGVGQSWSNVTGSRASGTTYTNTESSPIAVLVVFPDTPSQSPTATVVVGGVTLINALSYDGGNSVGAAIASFIVPPGATYSVSWTVVTGVQWNELR